MCFGYSSVIIKVIALCTAALKILFTGHLQQVQIIIWGQGGGIYWEIKLFMC